MTEAVEPVMDYAFNSLDFNSLVFSNAVGNISSRRIKEKTGAHFVEIKPASFVDPQYTQNELWTLSKDEWLKFRTTELSESKSIAILGSAPSFKISLHESGHRMLVFAAFRPNEITSEKIASLIDEARNEVPEKIPIVRVCLDSDQTKERSILEEIGFVADGFKFGIEIEKLSEILPRDKTRLPPDYSFRRMDFQQDIDSVVELEKSVHAADQTSRVNFETAEAIAGMMGYYKKACLDLGVYLLLKNEKLIGLIGFMPDQNLVGAVHISSVSIELASQGKGLFLPLLLAGLRFVPNADRVTGVTTTTRLLDAANRYSVPLIGVSLVRFGQDA